MPGEVGIEWVKNYHGHGDLSNTQAQAEGFYNEIAKPPASAIRRFNYGDDSAWDQDFQDNDVDPNGTDHKYIDNVDIVFFSGHGNQNGPRFGRADRDDGQARPDEIRWGNKDLEWIAFDACLILANHPTSATARWRQVFQGLHYILGFATTCQDERNRGKRFAYWLNRKYTVRCAWIKATKETEGSGVRGAYLRADETGIGTNTYNDHYLGCGFVSADPEDPDSFVWCSWPC